MPLFETPKLSPGRSAEWIKTAKPIFHSPKFWEDCWLRFNIMPVPILSERTFFDMTILAARRASSRKHFEELLGEEMEKKRRETRQCFKDVAFGCIYPDGRSLATATRDAALGVCQTGSLEHMQHFLGGIIFGWISMRYASLSRRISSTARHTQGRGAGVG